MVEISAAVAAFKAAKDLGKVVYDAKIDSDVKDRYRSLMDKLGDAQDTLYELRDELLKVQSEAADLKLQIAASDEWKGKVAAYTLVKTDGGAVVYKSNEDPAHYVCPNCVNHKRIVPLQTNRTRSGKYRCVDAGCKAEFPIDPQQPEPPAPPLNYPGGGNGWMER